VVSSSNVGNHPEEGVELNGVNDVSAPQSRKNGIQQQHLQKGEVAKNAQKGGVCVMHGANEGCNNQAKKGGSFVSLMAQRRNAAAWRDVPIKSTREEFVSHMVQHISAAVLRGVPTKSKRAEYA
jgi:hypothetical protein